MTDTTTSRRMGNPRFAALQARIDRGQGLLAREWDWWTDTFKQLDPEEYASYRARVKYERVLRDAKEFLTLEDLRAIIAEKEVHAKELPGVSPLGTIVNAIKNFEDKLRDNA